MGRAENSAVGERSSAEGRLEAVEVGTETARIKVGGLAREGTVTDGDGRIELGTDVLRVVLIGAGLLEGDGDAADTGEEDTR